VSGTGAVTVTGTTGAAAGTMHAAAAETGTTGVTVIVSTGTAMTGASGPALRAAAASETTMIDAMLRYHPPGMAADQR